MSLDREDLPASQKHNENRKLIQQIPTLVGNKLELDNL